MDKHHKTKMITNFYRVKFLLGIASTLCLMPIQATGGTIEKDLPEDLEVISISGFPPSNGSDQKLISVPILSAAISENVLNFLCQQQVQKVTNKITSVPPGGDYLIWIVTCQSNGIPFVMTVNANVILMSDGSLFRASEGRQLYIDFSNHLKNLNVIPTIAEIPPIMPANN